MVDELDTNINEFGESTLYHTIQSSEDCDICLRTGYVPGFELYGHNHNVLTTYDIVDILGFTITPDKPARLLKVAEKEGYVDFELIVPKYFSYIKYSVRDNHHILDTILSNFKDGASVIISTHLIADIERILDEVIFIDKGKIILTGDADTIREKEKASIDAIFRRSFKC